MTNLAIAHARLRNSRLVPDPALPGLVSSLDVVRWFGAVQSQDVPGAFWAVAQRLPAGTSLGDLESAFDAGSIVRTHALRPTWHFLAPDDLRWIEALTGPRVQRANAPIERRLGLDEGDFERVAPVFREVLAGGRAATRQELRDAIVSLGIDLTDPLVPSFLAMRAELEGLLVSGPRRGRQFTYQLVDERIPPIPRRDRDDALRDLTIRYFRSHGPALVKDMAWWSGLTMTDVRRGIDLAESTLERRSIDELEYIATPDGFDPGHVPAPHLRLLSNYDEYLGSYADYSPIYDPSLPKVRTVADVLGAHIVLRNGLVVGGWRRALGPKQLTVTVTLLADLTTDECDALAAEADAVGRFFGMPVDLRLVRS